MEVISLLLVFYTVTGYSYILQPRLSVMQMAGTDPDHRSEMRSEQQRDESLSAVERKNENKNIATVEEWRRELVSPQTNPVRKTVKTEKTVNGGEKKGEDELTSETKPAMKSKIEEKDEDEIHRNKEKTLERNQGYEKQSEERVTSERFFESIKAEIKRREHSVADTGDNLDTEVAEEIRDDGQNSKTQTNDDSRTVKTILTHNRKQWKIVKACENHKAICDGADVKIKKNDRAEPLKQTIVEEERERELVPRISLHKETSGDNYEDEKIQTVTQKITEEKAEISATSQTSFSPSHQYNAHPPLLVTPTQIPLVSSLPPTPHVIVSPQLLPSVTAASPTVPLIEDLTEVLPGHRTKQNDLVVVTPNVEDVMLKNLFLKPAQMEIQTTHKAQEINTIIQPNENIFTPKVQEPTPKPKDAKFEARDFKSNESNPTPKSNEYKLSAKLAMHTLKANMTQPTGKHKTVQLIENGKLTKPQLIISKTPSKQPTQNKRSKNKTIDSKEKKRKKDIKTQKKNKVAIPAVHFPYFMDNYCPPECACYGRVVQCSGKQLDTVPYGIPYNVRYILLMNNHINSIQLGLLSQYVSVEFLVLSNNQLTNGATEGAFDGMSALKRFYLDGNLLERVPADLPASLEEIRLDNNRLSVVSKAAWVRCPGLLVLSLSNNSLGSGSESLPNAVFSPLYQLHTLNLDHNQLTSVPLGLPLSIKELYLKGNLIEQFHGGVFDGISELVVLDLSANRLIDKGLLIDSLINATQLESINFEGNRLKQVPRHLPLSVKTLNLEGNRLTSIKKAAFHALTNLEHLGLARNKIFKVAPGAFRTLPVLHHLDLCHNSLHQVPRQLPPGLHSVALTHNKIQSVPRDAFCWGNKSLSLSGLVRVQLEHNLIDMGKLDVHAFRCLRGFQVVHFY